MWEGDGERKRGKEKPDTIHISHLKRRPSILNRRPSDLKQRPSILKRRPSDLKRRPSFLKRRPSNLTNLRVKYCQKRSTIIAALVTVFIGIGNGCVWTGYFLLRHWHKAKDGHRLMPKNRFLFCFAHFTSTCRMFFYQVRANVVVSDWFQFLIHIHN